MTDGRCATCAHWEYVDQYTPEWESLPLTHLFAWGDCALFNSEERELREVDCGDCEAHDRAPSIDTHWTFGCILWETRA